MSIKYSEQRLKSIFVEYVESLDYSTKIVWQKLVKWAKDTYPEEMKSLSYEYFSRSPVLRGMRDEYNNRVESFITDMNSVESVVQNYSLDWRELHNLSEPEQQGLIFRHNRKISGIIDSHRKIHLKLEETRYQLSEERKRNNRLKEELSREKEKRKQQIDSFHRMKKNNHVLTEQNKALYEFIENHINTPIVQQHFLELGIIAPSESATHIEQTPLTANGDRIISSNEAKIIERLKSLPSMNDEELK